MAKGSVRNQYFAAMSVNILSIGYGALCGWPSASFPTLKSQETPLQAGPLSDVDLSWIAAILCVGGFTGNLFFGWLCEKIGRKFSLIFVAGPQMVSWLIIFFAPNLTYLLVARFIGGFCGGGAFVVIPLYTVEISEDRIRGTLGSFLVLSCNFGILLAYILGTFFTYDRVALIFGGLPIIFMIGFYFLIETPLFLYKNNKEQAAENSLRYFRNVRRSAADIPDNFRAEIEKLKNHCAENAKKEDDEPISWKDFSTPVVRKAFLIGLVLVALNQLCGCFAMLNYAATIFEESGSNLSPNISAIIVGFIQLVGSYISTMLVERSGRKFLLSVSAIGTGTGLLALGIYVYLQLLHYDVSYFNWLPVTSFSFTIFIASWGVLNLPFVVLSEIMPTKIRSFGTSFCMSVLWVLAFAVLKCLPFLTNTLGMHGTMFVFAACSYSGGIFILAFVPETKGKSLEAILRMLE